MKKKLMITLCSFGILYGLLWFFGILYGMIHFPPLFNETRLLPRSPRLHCIHFISLSA